MDRRQDAALRRCRRRHRRFRRNGRRDRRLIQRRAVRRTRQLQEGKGLGILSDGDQGPVKGRNYFLQGTYKVSDKLKFGINYGESRNQDDNARNTALNASFKSNANLTAGLYYGLTKSITLAGELGDTRSKDYLGNTAKMFGGSFGGIIFF